VTSKKNLRIAFLTSGDARDRRFWSGTPHFMARALERNVGEVIFLGPANLRRKIAGRAANWAARRMLGKKYDHTHAAWMAKGFARFFLRKLSRLDLDVILAPAASTEIAFLKTEIPILYVSDATFVRMVGYYAGFSNLLDYSVREGNRIEGLAIKNSALSLFSCRWAAESAIADYGADPARVCVIPFGANLAEIPERETVLQRKKNKTCRLLFLARNWERKGGNIAFETLLKLEQGGLPAELTVCGCTPPSGLSHGRMTVIPFLDKNDPAQEQKLGELFLSSDLMLVPTRADCTPIVFCEAAAFGLPVIATDTGGVSGVVAEGVNGHLLPPEATGEAFARLIAEICRDDERYYQLVRSSRRAFEEKYNWDVWAQTVRKLISEKLGLR
jgi:glycosyltransferase involved in cell wall biosynthesis